jgi:hypothetical protein
MRRHLVMLAVPAVLVLAACGPQDHAVGESVAISDGELTVTAIEQGTADDVAELELDELEGQTPYFIRYEVDLNDGADGIDESRWQGSASSGDVTAINVIQIGDGFDCTGLGEIVDGEADGCQLVMVEEGASLDWVAFGGAGRWTTD